MILVLTGTITTPFNRLFMTITEAYKNTSIKVIIQGNFPINSPYKNIQVKTFLDENELKKTLTKATHVVIAPGEGSIIDLLFHSPIKPIVFPRLKAWNEHVDDQQKEVAVSMEKKKLVQFAKTEAELLKSLRKKPTKNKLYNPTTTYPLNRDLINFLKYVSEFV